MIKKIIKYFILRVQLVFFKKIIIGSSGTKYFGWISTDKEILNVLKTDDFKRLLKKNMIEAFLAEHVWEHLTLEESRIANKNCYFFLKKGGHLRIAVPDGYNPNPEYINNVKIGGKGKGGKDHKVLYNYKMTLKEFNNIGFRVKLLEYWDENANFHSMDWKKRDGMIRRSSRYDKRNIKGRLEYTSLIVDAIKD